MSHGRNSRAPMALNLILGHSARAAISTMERCRAAQTLCVVSPSPRQERRMTDEELVATFTHMGSIMKRVTRMETHFYSSNTLWLPAKALTEFLRNALKVEDFLLNGCRIKGADQDIIDLGVALLQHPTLERVTFFNIGPYHDPTGLIADPQLSPLLEGATRSLTIREFTLRFAGWANPYLSALVHPTLSNISVLKCSGKDMLFGGDDCGENSALADVLEALKTNSCLKEIWFQQAAAPRGSGVLFADMLRENESLEKLCINLSVFHDCIAISQVLAGDNTSLTCLELYVDNQMSNEDYLSSDPPPYNEAEIEAAQAALEEALVSNGSLLRVKMSCRQGLHTTDTIEFYTRVNAAGRMEVLTNDELTGEEVCEFLTVNADDHSMIFHILSTKPSLLAVVVDHCTNLAPFPKARRADESLSNSESDDDKPIRFLVSKARIESKRKRKKRNTTIQAARAKTLKRRRHK